MSEQARDVSTPDALDALRARGVDRIDPVRLRLAEALARRAAAHTGDARRLIDARLAALIDDLGARVAAPAPAPARPAPHANKAPGPLAALLAHHAGAARPATKGLPGADAGTGTVAPAAARGEPAGAGYFRATWARLSAEQRLAQSRQRLPDNAGPLNSQHLVHRSLALMHEVSPECLQHFMAQMDGLMWLDQVSR